MQKTDLKITVLQGDGIGPEVVQAALSVLDSVANRFAFRTEYLYADIGGSALEKSGHPFPPETLQKCRQSDAILLGAIGDPKWDHLPADSRPERGLLALRQELGLYANLRPARVFSSLADASSLKREIVQGIDILFVRELTGGIYFGTPRGFDDQDGGRAYNTMVYSRPEIERIAHVAFQAAQKRSGKVTSVDKANVLHVSQLWRQVVTEISGSYPEIELDHLYVDNAAMQLIRDPKQFDVILTGNMFGDILSDEAAMLTGSLGMLPSASTGTSISVYEPVHGSAPDIAGQNKANPIATIASVAMMLRYSFSRGREAELLEKAIDQVLESGFRTQDIAQNGSKVLSTQDMGKKIIEAVTHLPA